MTIFNILTIIGGLAFFLYGMNVMGEGLSKITGGRLENTLEKLTSGKLKAVLFGAVIAAVMQSSQTTAAIVVGFVNSGLMRLSQAVGIIMGANAGATVTSWFLSLSGIEGNGFFAGLLKPAFFFPVAAVAGIILRMSAKRDKHKNVGTVAIGFAILMYGMETISGVVKPLADMPEFENILLMFSHPVLGMLTGLVFTVILQSSSASVGILQALSLTGAVRYSVAVPVIIGQNAGACVTAVLASVGTGKDARRAALVHFYFNLISAIISMTGFYGVNVFARFIFMESAVSALGIAVIHTLYNIFAIILMLPFSARLEQLACYTIKDAGGERDAEQEIGEKEAIRILDPRFLSTPGFALEQCKTAALNMVDYVRESLLLAMELLVKFDWKKALKVARLEETADSYEDKLGSYLVRLNGKHLSGRDGRELSILLHCIADFERISDHARNIMKAAAEMQEKNVRFSKSASEELEVITNAVRDMANTSFLVFQEEDIALAGMAERMKEVIGGLYTDIRKNHVKRLQKGRCTIERGFLFSDILTDYTRIADHCANIALCFLQIQEGSLDIHGYHETERDEDEYKKEVKRLKKHYRLP